MNKNIPDNILYCITNVFYIYCLFRLAGFLFRKKENINQVVHIMAYVFYFLLNTTCHILMHNPVINMVTNILSFFLITFLYETKNKIRVIITVMTYAVFMAADSIIYALTKSLNIDSVIVTSGVATTIILLMTEQIFEKCIKNHRNQGIPLKHIFALMVVPAGSIVIGIFTMQPEQFEHYPQYITVECFVMLIMNVVVFVLYDTIGRMYEQQQIQIALETQNNAYANQIRLINMSNNQIRYLKHDLKNHLLKIRIMAQNDDCEGILSYIDESEKYITIPNVYTESGNTGIDSILNLKLYEAETQGVQFHTEISVPNKLNISDFDINIILGNLLDNAVHALSLCSNKKLYIKIKYEPGILHIVIKNTFKEETKKNTSEEHGLGLFSVENTVKKYKGVFAHSQKNDIYTANLILYI